MNHTGTMPNPWEKRESETPRAFGAFGCYLKLGSKRTLKACSDAGEYSETGVRKWSARHDWELRASDYDSDELDRDIQGRERVRERARQIMIDDVEEAARTLGAVMRREIKLPECSDRCTDEVCHCGLRTPTFDRHGEHVGDRATVTPAEARASALAILDRCGMAPPKRVELTGKDGERLRLDARLEMGKLTGDKLDTILDIFAPDPDAPAD